MTVIDILIFFIMDKKDLVGLIDFFVILFKDWHINM